MLIAGHLMVESSAAHAATGAFGTVELVPGWIEVQSGGLGLIGRITRSGSGKPPGTPDLGADAAERPGRAPIICPGFVDTHLHLPQFDSIGADGMELLPWLQQVIFPAETRWADPDYAGQMAARVADKLLAHGSTAIAAYGTVHHAGTQNAIHALATAGLAGVVGQVLMDREAPVELLRPADQLLREAAAMTGAGRIAHAVTPRFAVSCSEGLLRGAGELAVASRAVVQTHLSESRAECELVRRLYPTRSGRDTSANNYVNVYLHAGLLGPRTLLGHGIWLDESERGVLNRQQAIVAHCPTANLFLQSGTMSLRRHSESGVRVSLGSDVAGGPDVAMPRVARAMIETAKVRRLHEDPGAVVPTAAEAWWLITAGNADALGLGDAGRIRVGAAADLVILEPAAGPGGDPCWNEAIDPLGAVLYGWDPRWIAHTLTGGRIAYSA